jgi:hypothetical protein
MSEAACGAGVDAEATRGAGRGTSMDVGAARGMVTVSKVPATEEG